jgi:hypothetical protein
VLTDQELNNFSRTYDYLIDQRIGPKGERRSAHGCYVLPFVWNELTDWIGLETVGRLEQWFWEFFRDPFNSIGLFYLLFLRVVHKPNARYANPFPLGERERMLIKECVDLFRKKRSQISKRLKRLQEELECQRATPWDAVIETFPVDSGVHGRHLPQDIQRCLEYQLKLQLLNELKAALGEEAYDSLMAWGYQEIMSDDWSDLG